MDLPDVTLSAETYCSLAALNLKDALKNLHLATKAHELDPNESGAISIRAVRDLVWAVLPQMADVAADHLGYQDGKAA